MTTPLRSLIVAALMLTAWAYMRTHQDQLTPLPLPFREFPTSLGDWRLSANTSFSQQTLDVLRPTDYLARRFTNPDGSVADLYIGYHDGASKAGPLHSPKNCLPGSGWFESSSRRIRIELKDGPIDAVMAVYQQGSKQELFLYWFQVAGKTINNEYSLKLSEVLNSIGNARRDAAFVRISVPVNDSVDKAAAQAKNFLEAAHPSLKRFLPS